MIIDFHTHCYTDALAKKAIANSPKDSPFGPFFDCTKQGLLDYLAKCGVSRAVTLHIAAKPEYVPKVNDWVIECNNTPNLYGFGTIHPLYSDFKTELRRLKSNGIKGIKFHPYVQQFDIDDRKMYPIYQEIAANDMIMLFHTGTSSQHFGDYASPKKFNRFVDDFLGAKIVGAHLGGAFWWQEAFDLMLGKDFYLDTSFAFRYLSNQQKKRVLLEHDNKKILFGSDTPWVEVADDIKQLKKYLTKENSDDILYKNALRLLGESV